MERVRRADGWHGYNFLFGANNNELKFASDEDLPKNDIYEQEKISTGCYRTTVDFDRLDQQ